MKVERESFIVRGEQYNARYGLTSRGTYTPYFVRLGGRLRFVGNIVKVRGYTAYDVYKHNRLEMKNKLLNLRSNDYKFIRNYGGSCKTPIEVIELAIKNGYTFQTFGDGFFEKGDGFTDFHGNFHEYS